MNKYRSINKVAKFSKPLLLSTLLLSCFNIAIAKDYNNLVCAFPSANGLDGEYRWHVFNPSNYDYKAQRGADLQIDGAVKEFIDTTTGLWYGYQRALDPNGKWLSYQDLRNLCKDHAKSQYKGWISENTIPYMFTSYYGHDFKSDIWEMWVADAAQPSSPFLGTDIRKIITFGDSLSDDGNATYNASLRWYSTNVHGLIGHDLLPHPASYWFGHFSNGNVWSEYLADKLQIPVNNFAAGGSLTYSNQSADAMPGLGAQVRELNSAYKQDDTFMYNPNHTLYTFLAGNNNIYSLKNRNDSQVERIGSDTEGAINDLIWDGDGIKNGDMHILVLGLPDAARAPSFNQGVRTDRDDTDKLFKAANIRLRQAVEHERLRFPNNQEVKLDQFDLVKIEHYTNNAPFFNASEGGFSLKQGQAFRSINAQNAAKTYQLVMQPDNNLVLYRCNNSNCEWGTPIWSSQTNDIGTNGAHAEFQSDGNLVVYGKAGSNAGDSIFSAGVSQSNNSSIILQGDGNLVIYSDKNGSGSALWASAQSKQAATGHKLNIDYFDLFSVMDKLINHYQTYGYSNVTNSCLNVTSIDDKEYEKMHDFRPECQSGQLADSFFFWDLLHPTTKTHKTFAEQIEYFLINKYGPNLNKANSSFKVLDIAWDPHSQTMTAAFAEGVATLNYANCSPGSTVSIANVNGKPGLQCTDSQNPTPSGQYLSSGKCSLANEDAVGWDGKVLVADCKVGTNNEIKRLELDYVSTPSCKNAFVALSTDSSGNAALICTNTPPGTTQKQQMAQSGILPWATNLINSIKAFFSSLL